MEVTIFRFAKSCARLYNVPITTAHFLMDLTIKYRHFCFLKTKIYLEVGIVLALGCSLPFSSLDLPLSRDRSKLRKTATKFLENSFSGWWALREGEVINRD